MNASNTTAQNFIDQLNTAAPDWRNRLECLSLTWPSVIQQLFARQCVKLAMMEADTARLAAYSFVVEKMLLALGVASTKASRRSVILHALTH